MQKFSLLMMPDGRTVRVRELGPIQGFPVVHLHGIPSSCLEFAHHAPVLADRDVRLISIERPGYGASDPGDFASVAAWVGDLEHVADALELDRFNLLGFSGGGVFALAGAAALPARVDRVSVVGCPAPFTGREFLDGMAPQNRALWMLAREGRVALAAALAPMASDPSALADQLLEGLPAADAAIFEHPAARGSFRDGLIDGMRQGIESTARDLALIASAWGFDLAQVAQRVDIWHGGADVNLAVNHAARLGEGLQSPRIHIRAGQGHFDIHGPALIGQVLGVS